MPLLPSDQYQLYIVKKKPKPSIKINTICSHFKDYIYMYYNDLFFTELFLTITYSFSTVKYLKTEWSDGDLGIISGKVTKFSEVIA